MRLVGFGYKKINIEKLSNSVENLKINTNIDILNIKTIKSNFLKSKDEVLEIEFKYDVNYEPSFAKIELAGNVLLEVESKITKNILKQWKDKKIPEDFKMALFNLIIKKSNIKALQLEDEMNLPYHVPFPTLKSQDKKE